MHMMITAKCNQPCTDASSERSSAVYRIYDEAHMRGPRAQRTSEGEGGEGADGGKDNYLRCWSISQTEGGGSRPQPAHSHRLTDMWREILDFC